MRASDADRDRAAALLREHHASGRLSGEEFHERLNVAMTAKTLGDLDELMADLPAIDLYELPDATLRRQLGGRVSREVGKLPWESPGRYQHAGEVPDLPAGTVALIAWATVAATLVLIGLVTGILVGGLSAWWVFAAIPVGTVTLIWLLIRRSPH